MTEIVISYESMCGYGWRKNTIITLGIFGTYHILFLIDAVYAVMGGKTRLTETSLFAAIDRRYLQQGFFIFITMYGVVCIQLAHFSSKWLRGYIIKSEVSTFPIVIIFFCGCVPEMFVTSCSVTYCIYVLGKPGIGFHYYCTMHDECKYSDMLWLADRTGLFVQYNISLSSLCKFI